MTGSSFHRACDYKGATLSICYSFLGHIYGLFTTIPWKSSNNDWVKNAGQIVAFRLINDRRVVRATLKKNVKYGVLHQKGYLFWAMNFGIHCEYNYIVSYADTSSNLWDNDPEVTDGAAVDKLEVFQVYS